jgi:two-component system LytT family response regulator
VDYLLKPFSDDRFAEALAHAKAQVRQRRLGRIGRRLAAAVGTVEPAPEESAPLYADRLLVPSGDGSQVIRAEAIDWIEARNYCAKLHVGAREHLVRQTLKALEARLDPARFVRIHRSAIVNLDRIRTLEPYFHGSQVVILVDGTRLPLSRARRGVLEGALGDRLG